MLVEALRNGLTNYVNFEGRTGRSTFWWYVLGVFVILLLASILDRTLFGAPTSVGILAAYAAQPITTIVSLAFLLPNLAMAVRRLHDIGKSGWWILVGFVPIVGLIVLIYFYVQPSSDA